MRKKIISICLASFMAVTLMVANPISSFAYENSGTISSNTVITNDNIAEVLINLGINQSNFEKCIVIGESITTVGELEKAVMQVKQQPKEIKNTDKYISLVARDTADLLLNNNIAALGVTYSKTLYRDSSVGSYTLEYSVSAAYSGKAFTSASSPNVTVDSDFILYTYKISGKSCSAACTPAKITETANFYVDTYVGVQGVGLVRIGHQKVSSTIYWYAATEL